MISTKFYLSLLLSAAVVVGCSTSEIPFQTRRAGESIRLAIGDESLVGTNKLVSVPHDEVYNRPKRYLGEDFGQFLKSVGGYTNQSVSNVLVEFVCNDGYKPIARLETLLSDSAFLATRDSEALKGRNWVPFLFGNGEREPGPVYLIWPKLQQSDDQHPLPYGIVSINITTEEGLFDFVFPTSRQLERGFNLFQRNCMKCHSVNGVGGSVGVDLNVPLNVFEYWRPSTLHRFVQHPERYRLHSKMPSFTQLDDEQISQILGYIQSMKTHKVLPK